MEHGFLYFDNYNKEHHFNVVLFSIGYYNRKNYVVAYFSLPQGEKNQIVGFDLFFLALHLGGEPIPLIA
jgi:hypothetical protein